MTFLHHLNLPGLPEVSAELDLSLREGAVIAEGIGENGWSYKEQLPSSTLKSWLESNISSNSLWKVNSGSKDGLEMLHLETEPKAGRKLLYIIKQSQPLTAMWALKGKLLHQESLVENQWYLFRTDVEHYTS